MLLKVFPKLSVQTLRIFSILVSIYVQLQHTSCNKIEEKIVLLWNSLILIAMDASGLDSYIKINDLSFLTQLIFCLIMPLFSGSTLVSVT